MNERQNLEDKFQRCKVCVTTQKYLCYMNRDREEAGSQKAAAMSQLLSKGRREQEKNTPTRERILVGIQDLGLFYSHSWME